MLSFAKFDNCKSHPVFLPFLLFVREFFKRILADSRTLFVFCYSSGAFLNDVKLGILILITNMALKIQNDVIIRKTVKTNMPICQQCKNV